MSESILHLCVAAKDANNGNDNGRDGDITAAVTLTPNENIFL